MSVSFNTQKVEIVIKKQAHMHLNFIDPKIKIFCYFRVFILRPIPKNENPEITEILQKGHNTKMWEYSWLLFKWDQTQNHVAGCCLLRAPGPH